MDSLIQKYNQRIEKVVLEYQKKFSNDPSFAVIADPLFSNLSIRDGWPLESLSSIDCFHPAASSHEIMAVGVW